MTHSFDSLETHPIRLSSLPDMIYARLRDAILTGDLQPGQRIVELDIATRMGTSQGPVREALQRLKNDGLVGKQPRSGTFVTSIPDEDIIELFHIRAQVEKFAVKRATCNLRANQVEMLNGLVAAMQAAAAGDDLLDLAKWDMEFHRNIVIWSGSPSLLQVWMPLYLPIQRYVTQNHRKHFENLVEIANLHLPVVQAMQSNDPEKAGQAIEEHILLTVPG